MPTMSDEWQGCYRDGWGNLIVPEAFAHPAKFSRSLISTIYQHAIALGWLKAGDMVLDPFAGVALGALDAMRFGLSWIGIELEEKFVAFGQQNIARWNERFGQLPTWTGTARIIQGDSRELLKVVGGAECCVTSPPYAGSLNAGTSGIDWSKVRGPGGTIRDMTKEAWNAVRPGAGSEMRYSSSPANLGNLPEGSFDSAISSPPYAASPIAHIESGSEAERFQRTGMSARARSRGNLESEQYGTSPGQLASLPEGDFQAAAAISSPPYEGSEISDNRKTLNLTIRGERFQDGRRRGGSMARLMGAYQSEGTLGNSSGNTFWSAARVILEQTFGAIRPGGHAIFVVKRFIRAGCIVDFPAQWSALCQSVGFVPICTHRAMLARESPPQRTTDGDVDVKRTTRMSFFRRLHATKYPHLAIDWEDVQCFRRP